MPECVLITGANRGIGLEFARQYLLAGHSVFATCRDPAQSAQLNALQDSSDDRLQVLQLDVTDAASIAQLATSLSGISIDVLINNAGVYGPSGVKLGQLDEKAWIDVLRVNTIAPLQLTAALLPNLQAVIASGNKPKFAKKKIIAISSRMGSIADNSSGGAYLYRSSKAALNAAIKSLALDLQDKKICVAILHPGWVATDMGGPKALIDAETSVAGMRQVIENLELAQSGGFFSYDGSAIPW